MVYLISIFVVILVGLQAFGKSKPLHKLRIQGADPQLDVEEIVSEIKPEDRKPSQQDSNSPLNFGLKKIEKEDQEEFLPSSKNKKTVQNRRTAGIQLNEDEKNMVPLIQETLFDKEKVRRDLDIYLENQTGLSLEDEPVATDLGDGMEIQWEQPEEID